MKKRLGLFIAILMGTFVLVVLLAGSAQAGQDNDEWTRVHAEWSFDYGYIKKAPNGVVHDKWACNSDWQDCAGYGIYHPTSKFAEPPLDNECGNLRLLVWEGTEEFLDDEGDVSDFLVIGETYWFCDALGIEVFRGE